MCLPSTCSSDEIRSGLLAIAISHADLEAETVPFIGVIDCVIRDEEHPLDAGDITMM